MTTTQTIITAVIGSTALSSLLQFFINRYDTRHDTMRKISENLRALREDYERGRAIAARIRVLVSADETRQGVRHSQEWWDQVLDDCTFYDQYCHDNPTFRNKKATHAIEHLTETYRKVYDHNDFI